MANLQVKRVPDDLYERAKSRAQAEGISLSEYVLRTLRRDLELLPLHEWLAETRRNPVQLRREVDIQALMDETKDEIEAR